MKAIQRHYSNDLVVHAEMQAHARSLKEAAPSWLPQLSPGFTIKLEIHAVLVHGVPTSFEPAIEDHVKEHKVSNGEMLSSMSSVRWVNPKSIEEGDKHFS